MIIICDDDDGFDKYCLSSMGGVKTSFRCLLQFN